MTFRPGDSVLVAALGKGTVREVRNGGRYLIEVKGRSIVVDGAQLASTESTRPTRRSKRSVPVMPDSALGDRIEPATRSLDLHGKTVHEALDALDAFLNTAFLAGEAEIRIIHGRSGGRIKAAVHARLTRTPSIRGFRLDPRNRGVTIVML